MGLFAERSAELVIAVLAILKTGAAYLPLDPSYPRERLALMLADGGAPLVLVQPDLAALLPAGAARTLPLVPSAFDGAPWSGATATHTATAADLAYVVYTSGSTGVPKGVAVTHRSVVRLVRDTDYADFGPDQVFLMMAPVSFDASTFELWGPLLNGGCLAILPPGEVTLDGLERAIHDAGVTTLWLTAGLFHLVVDERLAALAPLRQLLAGGTCSRRRTSRACAVSSPACGWSTAMARPRTPPSPRATGWNGSRERAFPSAVRSRTPASWCSAAISSRRRSACPASSMPAAPASPWGISAGPP